MLKYKTERVIDLGDWDNFVTRTYNRPYNFQQQDGCKERGTHRFTVPDEPDDYENDSVDQGEMGVSFDAWLTRDPNQQFESDSNRRVWARNFYPDMQMIANDLHAKGLLEAGEYIIEIDW